MDSPFYVAGDEKLQTFWRLGLISSVDIQPTLAKFGQFSINKGQGIWCFCQHKVYITVSSVISK